MKVIKEVTYYCKECEVPFADQTMDVKGEQRHYSIKVKTGNLTCPQCHKVIAGNKEFV